MRTTPIRLEPLTPEAFAPFGQIIAERDAPPVFAGPGLASWRMAYEAAGASELMVVRYDHRPLELTMLERHLNVSQSFVALGGVPSVMVVAAPTGEEAESLPAPGDLRAFLVPGGAGILLWRATWHALTRFPLRPEGGAFLMVTGRETQRELERQNADGTPPRLTQVVDFAARAGVRLEVVDPQGLLAAA